MVALGVLHILKNQKSADPIEKAQAPLVLDVFHHEIIESIYVSRSFQH